MENFKQINPQKKWTKSAINKWLRENRKEDFSCSKNGIIESKYKKKKKR